MEMVTMRNADRLLIVSIALLAVYYIVSILVPDLTSPIIATWLSWSFHYIIHWKYHYPLSNPVYDLPVHTWGSYR